MNVHHLIPLFEFYKDEQGSYPISLEEAKIKEIPTPFYRQFKAISGDIEKYCPSPLSYQVSPDGKDYTLSIFLGYGKEFFISSAKHGEREILPPLELQDFYRGKEVWKGNSQYTKITINAPSFLTGGISGLICFQKFKKYALIGLSNLFTIFGLILVIILVKKEEYSKSSKPAFLGLFFIIYLIFSISLAAAF